MKKAIEIKDLSYVYPDGAKALWGISLDILRGESWGIIGPNGAGKSTLLLLLNGILKGRGGIRVLGRAVEKKNLPWIRSKLGVVFQDPDTQLFMPTAFDDVAFGPVNMGMSKEEVKRATEAALSLVDMASAGPRSPHHLSLGEKRRISLATVLAMRPDILALDEPSSNLDPKHRRQLISFLKGLNLTKIIASHDLGLVSSLCSKIALLDRGRLVVRGDSRDILENRALLREHDLD